MVKNNYLEPNKVTLVARVDKALQQSLKKENVKLRFKVYGIYPLNPATMVEKFGLGDVFIIIEEEKHEVSYHSNAIDEYSNSEVEATIKLLNMPKTFQVELPTIFDCPPSTMPCYYVEMSNNLNITTNNHEED
jgi:PDZ domain-containing secreted protein